MTQSPTKSRAPWHQTASPRTAFFRGIWEAPSTPAFVLFATFVGFGALARESGFSLGQAMFTTATVWALPGQVVMADEITKGALVMGTAFAVSLTAVRLLPLVVSLLPLLRSETSSRPTQYLMAHFIAITVWVESMRRLPPLPRQLRPAYYFGFASTLLILNIFATGLGYTLASNVPPLLASALLFLTPIYFFLSLIAAARKRMDVLALVLGAALGPVFYLFAPGFDLLLTGLIGGTLAYGLGRLGMPRP